MTDLEARKAKLSARIKRKREEVHDYLDGRFYRSARAVLRRAEVLDADGVFRLDPSALPQYVSSVHKPMFWALIGANLSSYRYSTPQEFVEDMRLVVENCYAYNGESSKFSALARSIEIDMEDAFVKELGEAPPSVAEMKALSKRLPAQASTEILRVFNLYEKKETKTTNAKAFISLADCRCATKRRILQLMRDAVARKEARAGSKPAAAAPKRAPPVTGRAPPVKKPPSPAAKTALTAVAGGAGPSPPTTLGFAQAGVVQAADDVSFHNEQEVATATALERVPQNDRTGDFTLRDISPARLEDSLSDEADGTAGSGSYSPLESGFEPLDDMNDAPVDGDEAPNTVNAAPSMPSARLDAEQGVTDP